ncbi:hypothetical protein NPIL_501911, partial [Nephila pilipes]
TFSTGSRAGFDDLEDSLGRHCQYKTRRQEKIRFETESNP